MAGRAHIDPDLPSGDDLLDVRRDVEAMCAIVAASDTRPPLSIGLFGDWGTGKSFFMTKMQARVELIMAKARSERTSYCANIVQLRFNAWTYMDTDLWASLASEIFQGLARALEQDEALRRGTSSIEEARAKLMASTAHLREVKAEAERRRVEASAALRESEERLETLTREERRIEEYLSPGQVARTAYRYVASQEETKQALEDAAKQLGVEDPAKLANDTRAALLELHGLWGAIRALVIAARNGSGRLWLWLVGSLIAFIGGVALLLAFDDFIVKAVAVFVPLFGSGIVLVGKVAPPLRAALAKIEDARKRSAEVREKVRREREDELRRARDAVHQRLAAEENTIVRLEQELGDLQQQLEDLQADRTMARFVRERRESTDYTRHFGVIARARDDFEQLAELLKRVEEEARTATEPPPVPRIDRIILYIDDLDRCPEDKVVDVLQAVHLLLAMPLFIVVVGVDSRWLLHSLRRHASAFRVDEDEDDSGMDDDEMVHWQSTPFNYLEKIFQIPFNLRPMDEYGFIRLIDTLAQGRDAAGNGQDAAAANGFTRPAAGSLGSVGRVQGQDGASQVRGVTSPAVLREPAAAVASPADAVGAGASHASGAAATARSTSPHDTSTDSERVHREWPVPANPPYLDLSEAERRSMHRMYPLIPTPRAAKRYINVYRLLRATLPDPQRLKLEDSDSGCAQCVLLLLAILTGFPQEGATILRELLERQPRRAWWTFVNGLIAANTTPQPRVGVEPAKDRRSGRERRKGAQSADATELDARERLRVRRWKDLGDRLRQVREQHQEGEVPLPSCAEFLEWVPYVARHSFESGRVVGAGQPQSATPRNQRPRV